MNQQMEDDVPYELYQMAWERKKQDAELTTEFILSQAKEIMEDFDKSGNALYEKLVGDRGIEAQKHAVYLKKEIKQFIDKCEKSPLSTIKLMKKDAPYELKERVIERLRFGRKITPNFILSQAREMIAEFSEEGYDCYEDISGQNGEEAQDMANELKAGLEEFVKKYGRSGETANLSIISPKETSVLKLKVGLGKKVNEEKKSPKPLERFASNPKERAVNFTSTLLISEEYQHVTPPL